MSSNLQNSIWPNEGGTLGQIKVQIPTGTDNDPWPTGDALVGNFVYQNGKLVGFVDTKALTVNESKSTVINYDYFDIELPFTEGEIAITRGERSKYFNVRYNPINDDNVVITLKYKGCKTVDDVKAVDANYLTNDIVDGVWKEGLGDLEDGESMFEYYSNLASFSSDLSSLTYGYSMFYECENLETFNSDLSNLTNGSFMFYGTKLASFSSDLSKLTNGSWMFLGCYYLESFNSDLSSLTYGQNMFTNCYNLESFNGDLSSLTNGESMFQDCSNLESFNGDLSSLTNGESMFYECENLETFNSDLSNLTNGSWMFLGCLLDTASVQRIADTINTPQTKGEIFIGIGNTTPNSQEEAAFNTIASKNWTVFVEVNGGSYSQWNPTSLIPIDGEEITNPIPFWAKPVPSDEKHARYVDENGNFYNILGGNFIYGDNLENYGMFTSLEDAAANMRLTKIKK